MRARHLALMPLARNMYGSGRLDRSASRPLPTAGVGSLADRPRFGVFSRINEGDIPTLRGRVE